MGNAFQMGQILYEAEAAFGENVNTYATMQLPITGAVDCSGLTQAKIDAMRTMAYRNAGTAPLLGVMGGTVVTEFYLPGHGTTTAGATTVNLLETLLGIVFGNATVSAASGTTASGGSPPAITTVASGTFTPGALFPLGVLGDGRANGQWGVVGTHAATTLTSLVGLTAPSGTDAVRSAVNIYPSEDPTASSITSIRLQLMTANLVYACHGCFPQDVQILGTNFQEFLKIRVTWGVSWFEERGAQTFPSTVTTERYNGMPNVGGSVFVNAVGTAVRAGATRDARNLTINYKLGIVPLPGPGAVNAYQSWVGAKRVPDEITLTWNEDAPAQTASPGMVTNATATTALHILLSMNKDVAFYFPNVVVTERPVQFNDGGINRLRFTGRALTGLTTTSNLTLSAMRIGLAG